MMVGVLRRRFHRLDPFGENLLDRRPIDRTRFERQHDRRRRRFQFCEKPIFVDSREPSRRRAKIPTERVAISSVFLASPVALVSFAYSPISRKPTSAVDFTVFAYFASSAGLLASTFARRPIAAPLLKTSTSKTIPPVGVRVERAGPFAAVRLRVAPFGVSSVVSFRAFLGQSHPFVFRSRLQSQGVRSGVKIRRSVKIGVQTFRRRRRNASPKRERARSRRARRFRSSN